MPTTTNTPNRHLKELLKEASMTSKGFARRMTELSNADGGESIAPSHTNVDRWLSGAISQPKPRTCEIMATVFSQALNRPISVDDLGFGRAPAEDSDTTPALDTASASEEASNEHTETPEDSTEPLVEQWHGDTHRPVHNRVSGNVGTVIQVGGNHYGGINL